MWLLAAPPPAVVEHSNVGVDKQGCYDTDCVGEKWEMISSMLSQQWCIIFSSGSCGALIIVPLHALCGAGWQRPAYEQVMYPKLELSATPRIAVLTILMCNNYLLLKLWLFAQDIQWIKLFVHFIALQKLYKLSEIQSRIPRLHWSFKKNVFPFTTSIYLLYLLKHLCNGQIHVHLVKEGSNCYILSTSTNGRKAIQLVL